MYMNASASPSSSPVNARRRRMLGGDVMAGLFGGSDAPSNAAYSPNGDTQAVANQRKKMLGGSAMSAMLSGARPQQQSNNHNGNGGPIHSRRQPRQRAEQSQEVQWGIRLIKDKCERKGRTLAQMFVRNTQGDGSIDYGDYDLLLRKLNINLPRPVQEAIFAALDLDGSGTVSLYEFLGRPEQPHNGGNSAHSPTYAYTSGAYDNTSSHSPQFADTSRISEKEIGWAEQMLRTKIETKRKSLRKTFLAIDQDRNGYVSFTEFQDLLRQLNANLAPGVAEAIFARYDRDRSGQIRMDEFVDAVKQQVPSQRVSSQRVPSHRAPAEPAYPQRSNNVQQRTTVNSMPRGGSRIDSLEAELARHEQIVRQLRHELQNERAAQASSANQAHGVAVPRHTRSAGRENQSRALQATSELYTVPAAPASRKSLSEAALSMMHEIMDDRPSQASRNLGGYSNLTSTGPFDAQASGGPIDNEAVLLDFMMRQPRSAY